MGTFIDRGERIAVEDIVGMEEKRRGRQSNAEGKWEEMSKSQAWLIPRSKRRKFRDSHRKCFESRGLIFLLVKKEAKSRFKERLE